MKILLLYYSPWWNATAYYGVTLAQGLLRAGHEVWFGTDESKPAADRAFRVGAKIFHINLQTENPFKAFREVRRLARFLDGERVDIVNTLSPPGHLFHFLATVFHGARVPLVRTCCDVREPNNHFFNRYLYGRRVRRLIFPCEANRQRYHRILRFPLDMTSIVHPGLDVQTFDVGKAAPILHQDWGIEPAVPVVGLVGRLSPEKGHSHFLRVAARVATEVDGVRFAVVGQEEEVPVSALRELAATLGIGDKVVFTGFVEDPRAYIDSFAVGVVSSQRSETVSRVALEYMASSLPVVVTNVNALPEVVVPDVTGFVYATDDVDGMAGGIVRLLRDVDMRRRFGERGRAEVVEKYTIEILAAQTLALFEDVLAES